MIIKTESSVYEVHNVITGDKPTCQAKIKDGNTWQDVHDKRAIELLARIVIQQMEGSAHGRLHKVK